jgi:hypothetical protein
VLVQVNATFTSFHGSVASSLARVGRFALAIARVVRPASVQVARVRVLSVHCVRSDDHVRQVDLVQQGHERGDLVGLRVDRHLPAGDAGGVVDRREPGPPRDRRGAARRGRSCRLPPHTPVHRGGRDRVRGLAVPTPSQRRAFDLLGAPIPLTLK